MKVYKSNKTYEEYDPQKVYEGICEAYTSAGEECQMDLIDATIQNLFIYDNISSKEIRRQVEESLMSLNKKVAKSYMSKYQQNDELVKKNNFIHEYIKASNASTGSKYDSNANVTSKNVVTLGQELYKLNNIHQNRYIMQNKIKSMYSKKLAEKYVSDIESHRLYKHDETAIPGMPYCVAITMYPFLTDGLKKLGGPSSAPTDLKYFCGQFINLVYSVSSQFAGACATPEFIPYLDYFIRKDYGDNYIDDVTKVVDSTFKKRTIEKVIENCFQQIVHSMNMPAGNRGYQSVFWNISYFDENYFKGVFGDFRFPDGTPMNWRTISWLQKKFMKWFNEERKHYILTFPVETMALMTDDHDVVDKEYADFTSEMWSEGASFFTYMSNSPDSLSSCCFPEDVQPIYKLKDSDTIHYFDTFKSVYEKYGPQSTIQAWNINPISGKGEWKDVNVIKTTSDKIMTIKFDEMKWKGESKKQYQIECTEDHIFPVKREEEIIPVAAKDIIDGDKVIFTKDFSFEKRNSEPLIYKEVLSVKKNSVRKPKEVFCFKFIDETIKPYFILSNGLVTHNCRLRNSIKDMEDAEHNHTQHQFSMGTASVATGSKGVMTINLNRVIQDAVRKYFKEVKNTELAPMTKISIEKENKNKVYEYIKKEIISIVEDTHKYQKAFNSIIKDFFEAGMLDVYTAGFISLNKQYLTIGVNGLTDAAEFLGIDCTPNNEYNEFVNCILETINISNKKDRTKECMFNTEFVPGENLSNKNYNWDKKDGYYVSPNHIMYSSYFFNPEDEELSLIDKFKLHGKEYVEYLDGGSALHANLKEHLSKAQYRQLLRIASEKGTN